MPIYYLDAENKKQGPYSVDQLKDLVKEGVIVKSTIIVNDQGRSAKAEKFPGFVFPETDNNVDEDNNNSEVISPGNIEIQPSKSQSDGDTTSSANENTSCSIDETTDFTSSEERVLKISWCVLVSMIICSFFVRAGIPLFAIIIVVCITRIVACYKKRGQRILEEERRRNAERQLEEARRKLEELKRIEEAHQKLIQSYNEALNGIMANPNDPNMRLQALRIGRGMVAAGDLTQAELLEEIEASSVGAAKSVAISLVVSYEGDVSNTNPSAKKII